MASTAFNGTLQRSTRIDTGIVDVVVMTSAPLGRRDRWRILTLRRAEGTRCTGAWEIVHGRIEDAEIPAQAAVREVFEETGLVVERLYSIAVNPFYLHKIDTVQLALVFAAIVAPAAATVGPEHDQSVWRTPSSAKKYLAWPRERDAVSYALQLLANGDAGAVEDVLRVQLERDLRG